MTENPYVGPRAFRLGEKLPARDREQRELTDLLIAERIVLLHSPSGAGKTSLIQAGVTPLLQAELLGADRFQPTMPLRVKTPPPPDRTVHNRYVYSIALDLLPGSQPEELESLTFPQVLKIYEEQQPVSGIPVLILDQFEEILTLNPADWDNQTVFFQEIGTVLVSRPIWTLFSMREEYIGGLDRFVRHIPGQLETTYRLDFLTANAAKIALQAPAQNQGIAFRDEAAAELIRRLRTVKVQRPNHHINHVEAPYVEPFQLQVVCQKLWQRLSREKGDNFGSIEIGDIKHHADVGQALRQYYADIVGEVARTTKADESAIRDWFETRLITEQHFRSQTQSGPMAGEADSQEILRALQRAYIIRSDTRAATTWYELSHDHLIAPVLEDNKKWRSSHLQPWQLVAREWHDTHRSELLLSGAGLRAAEYPVRAIQLTELERQFLDASARAEERRSLLARTRNALGLVGLAALVELVVVIVLLVILLG